MIKSLLLLSTLLCTLPAFAQRYAQVKVPTKDVGCEIVPSDNRGRVFQIKVNGVVTVELAENKRGWTDYDVDAYYSQCRGALLEAKDDFVMIQVGEYRGRVTPAKGFTNSSR